MSEFTVSEKQEEIEQDIEYEEVKEAAIVVNSTEHD